MAIFMNFKKTVNATFPILSQVKNFVYTTILVPFDVIGRLLNLKFTFQPHLEPTPIGNWIAERSIKHLHGPLKLNNKQTELIVVCIVRNGEKYVGEFIKHYQKLGAKHIFFLDNQSKDNTVQLIMNQKKTTVLQSNLPFGKYDCNFRTYMINRFAKNCWCLCVDIDEFFDYPYSNTIGLKSFLKYLNTNTFNAVACQMLDMFSNQPLSKKFGSLQKTYKYYDLTNIHKHELLGENKSSNPNIKFHKGGIRGTIFGLDSIYLTKYPLVFLRDGLTAYDYRKHYILRNGKIADISCLLSHFKLNSNLLEYSRQATAEKSHSKGSREYKKYYTFLKSSPDINIKSKAVTPAKYRGIRELIDNHFILISENYLKWVKKS